MWQEGNSCLVPLHQLTPASDCFNLWGTLGIEEAVTLICKLEVATEYVLVQICQIWLKQIGMKYLFYDCWLHKWFFFLLYVYRHKHTGFLTVFLFAP